MKKSLIKTICLLLSFLLCFVPYCIVVQTALNNKLANQTAQEEDAEEVTFEIEKETVPVVELNETIEETEEQTHYTQPLDPERARKKQEELIKQKELEYELIEERAATADAIAETETEEEYVPETTIAETASPQLTYLGQYRITFYDNCPSCCGQWAYMGITNSGAPCQANHTIACGPDIPFGTVIYIEGLGTYVCEDRGVSSGCIDVYVNNHGEIPSWGAGYFNCYIVN